MSAEGSISPSGRSTRRRLMHLSAVIAVGTTAIVCLGTTGHYHHRAIRRGIEQVGIGDVEPRVAGGELGIEVMRH